MKLTFSINPCIPAERRRELSDSVCAAVPNATVQLNISGDRLFLLISGETDSQSITDAVQGCVISFGFSCTLIYCENGGDMPHLQFPEREIPKKRHTVRLSVFVVSLIAAFLCAAIIGFVAAPFVYNAILQQNGPTLGTSQEQQSENYVGKIALIDSIFKEYSLYDTDGQLLLDNMLKAYAAATGDDYAEYYTAEEYAELTADNSANMVGIGVSITESKDPYGILIINVMENSPAAVAGILPGDVIVSIGSGDSAVSVAEKGYQLSISALQGEEGTKAEFTVRRGAENLFFSIKRAPITVLSVTGHAAPSDSTVGIVRILKFDIQTPVQFEAEMDRLIASGCTRFVFDVRNNPGGDLRSIMAVLSFFLAEKDVVLSTVSKDGTTVYYYNEVANYQGDYEPCSVKKEKIGKYRNYAKTVLINRYTASAAELFTAALSDYNLCTTVGETSFGKGIIQNIYNLSSFGYQGAIKLTTGYYCPPSGTNYHKKGIVPTVSAVLTGEAAEKSVFSLTYEEDTPLQAAVNQLRTE